MSNRHATQGFRELAVAVLKDIHQLVPTSDCEVVRDIERLNSLVENRGIGYLTLTLPAAGKIFDRSLAEGRLQRLALPGFAPIGGHVSAIIPAFLQGLWLRVFDKHGLLCEEPCIQAIAGLRQFFFCFKKARFECDPVRVKETLTDFYKVDESLRTPTLNWDGVCVDDRTRPHLHIGDESAKYDDAYWILSQLVTAEVRSASTRLLLDTVQQSLDCVASSLGEFIAQDWKPKHGSGSVSDGRVGEFHKWTFPTWSERLEIEFPSSEFGFPSYDHWVSWVRGQESQHPGSNFLEVETPSRLATVPKTMKGPRLIASEPTASQYCQQLILDYLINRVPLSAVRGMISFKDQTPNQQMALSASRDQKYATIDLSSASDCVSMWLVERAFRRQPTLLAALMASRSSYLYDPVSKPERTTKLRKFTTMGAATTFPVQTILYAAIAAGVALWMDGDPVDPARIHQRASSIRVFGDDIVIETRYARIFTWVLSYLGFEVNPDKTFLYGKFRESCGVDAYDGTDVTPTYILEVYEELTPTSIESVRQCSNNLFNTGMWATAECLLRTLPARILDLIPVVSQGSGFPGLTTFCQSPPPPRKKRWNEDTQQWVYKVITVVSDSEPRKAEGGACLLQYFLEAPSPDTMVTWSSGYSTRAVPKVRHRWVPLEIIEG